MSRRSLTLIDVIKHRACAIKFSCYCWANILHFFDRLFIKKFGLFFVLVLRLLLRAPVCAKLLSYAKLMTLAS